MRYRTGIGGKRRRRVLRRAVFCEPLEPRWMLSADIGAADAEAGFKSLDSVSAAAPLVSSEPPAVGERAQINWRGGAADVVAGRWIVRFAKPTTEANMIGEFRAASSGRDASSIAIDSPAGMQIEPIGESNFGLLTALSDLDDLLAWAEQRPDVLYIEPDFIVHAQQTLPNDPSFAQLYGLNNTGQNGGAFDADIDAPEAWDITTGSSQVVIAVIDSGMDYNHPDLVANRWTNPGEIAGNGQDDDGNGFIDDVFGWDFANRDSDPMDDNGHGTHVAGTIGARGDNGFGVAGVNWQVQIMPLKFLDSEGSGRTSDAISAIDYATRMKLDFGVNLVATNNSWGGGGFSSAVRDAIADSAAADILFVAAAGNDGDNVDVQEHYPAAYDLPNIISVAATDRFDQLAGFSNFGLESVDLAAPGVSIYSTVPGGGFNFLSGTSMAAPHVSGAVGIIASAFPQLNSAQIKGGILGGVDSLASLQGRMLTGGRLNLAGALAALTPPGSVEGVVWNDTNGDGVHDEGEPGLAGWTVFDDANQNGELDANSQTLASADVPKFIDSNAPNTVGSSLVVAGVEGAMVDVNVTLSIFHTWVGDLDVTLISPAGTRVPLFASAGGSGDHFLQTTFDDEAATPINAGVAPFGGSFRPLWPLSALNGESANGSWALQIDDTAFFDGGSLSSWSLSIDTSERSATTDAQGGYRLSNLAAGERLIRPTVRADFEITFPSSGVHTVEVQDGMTTAGVDFGLRNTADLLPYAEHFYGGDAGLFAAAAGQWQVSGGRYVATAESGGDAVSVLSLDKPLPAAIEIATVMQSGAGGPGRFSNAAVIFDYQGPGDFKFAGGFFGAGNFRIGRVTGGQWSADVVAADAIVAGSDYELRVQIQQSSVMVTVDGVHKASFDYGESLTDGSIGLAALNADASFDDFAIRALDGALLGAHEDFDDGSADYFMPIAGTWQTVGGRYEALADAGGDAVSLLSLNDPLPGRVQVTAVMQSAAAGDRPFSNAVIVFDYQSPTKFKFAGGFFGAGNYRIGHVTGGQWIADVMVPAEIAPDTDVNVEIVIDGPHVLLKAEGVLMASHDFGQPLNDGLIGLGAINALARFDDVWVEPVAGAALPFAENFDDGSAGNMLITAGRWQIANGRFEAGPRQGDEAIAIVQLADDLPQDFVISADVEAATSSGGLYSNAVLVFDYQSPTDFMFAGGFFGAGEWRIGQVTGGQWQTLSAADDSIGSDMSYHLVLTVEGGLVTLSADDIVKATFDFGSPLNGGAVGLASRRALALFDDLGVGAGT